MKRTALSLIAFALILAGLGTSASAQAETLRIGTEGAYPPFNLIDESGELSGFDIDIAKALCAKMEVECTFVAQDWDGIIPALLANKYDAIIASMSITEERKKSVAFTDRYYSNYLRFVAAKSSDIDTNNLSGKTIGTQRATISSQYLEDNLADEVSIKVYDTQEAAYLDLKAGRVDAVLADVYPSHDWLQKAENADFDFVGDAVDIDDKIGIAVRKDDTALVEKFNAALAAIVADGTYEKINAKYFPFSIY